MAQDVLIVGGGPTGLLLAIELARRGVQPRIVEKRTEPVSQSRALAVFARTLELFDRLGIVDRAIERGRRLNQATLHADGRRIAALSLSEIDSPFPFVLSLPQFETERLLEDVAREHGVNVERGVEVQSLTQGADRVNVQMRRADGVTEATVADWVVGCDGAHSVVREHAGFTFEGVDLVGSFLFADAKVNWEVPTNGVNAFFSRDGVAAAIPLPAEGYWRIIVDLPESEDLPATPDLEDVATRLRTRSGLAVTVSDPQWIAGFRVRQRKVDRYRDGRVLLAGDAAHAHSPVGGQGMNTGLQDAANLAWKLALVMQGRAGDALLDSYNTEREPIARQLLRGTNLATRAVTLRHPLAQHVRNHIASFLATFEVVQQRVARQMSEVSLNYRTSPLAGESQVSVLGTTMRHDPDVEDPSVGEWFDFHDGPHAGDRAPDCRVDLPFGTGAEQTSERVHLFDYLRAPWFVLFLFDGRAATSEGYDNLTDIEAAVTSRFGEFVRTVMIVPAKRVPHSLKTNCAVLLDPDERAHAKYGAAAESLYLIRPDGYIGFRSQPAEAEPLVAYLEGLLNPD